MLLGYKNIAIAYHVVIVCFRDLGVCEAHENNYGRVLFPSPTITYTGLQKVLLLHYLFTVSLTVL